MKQKRDILIVIDFVNELYVITDEFAELIEKRVGRVSNKEVASIQAVVDKIDEHIEKMVDMSRKAEGFIEKSLISMADELVEAINKRAKMIVALIDSLEANDDSKLLIKH